MRFDAPITLVGFTALSVETITKRFTPYSTDKSATFLVPNTLANIACGGKSSIKGTCLYAAAWKTTSGLYSLNIGSIIVRLRTSAIT